METVDKLLPTNDGHINECYVFHDPLEKVYEAITNINTITKLLSPNILIIKVLRETKIDDEGNEIYISILNNNFTLQTMSTQKVKNIIQYKLRCIHYPLCYCPFEILTQIFWDSIDKITVLHVKITIDDSPHQNELINFFKQNTVNFKKIEKYLKKTIKNLEENESITINVNIRIAWEFILKMENLKFFFPLGKITIKEDNNQIIKILDETSNNEIKLIRKEDIESDLSKMVYQLELFDSVIPMPKQLIEICLIKIREELTLMEFKHIILEYIPYDALISNSRDKQKILKKIKKILENDNK